MSVLWGERRDLNPRSSEPQSDVLANCTTPTICQREVVVDVCLSPLPHISFIWALASHLFEYKSNPPHNDDNAVMPIVFTRLSRHSVDLLPRNACREDGASSGNWTRLSSLARTHNNQYTIPAYQDTFNLCKILDSNQWLLVYQTNAQPTELISLLRFAVSVF